VWVNKQLEELCLELRKITGKSINSLIDRIKALEENQVTFGGTWKDGESYPEKCLVSFRGGLWLSKMPNNTLRPGEGPAWRLAVKAGTRRDVE
jgi:hypothetical protein